MFLLRRGGEGERRRGREEGHYELVCNIGLHNATRMVRLLLAAAVHVCEVTKRKHDTQT